MVLLHGLCIGLIYMTELKDLMNVFMSHLKKSVQSLVNVTAFTEVSQCDGKFIFPIDVRIDGL